MPSGDAKMFDEMKEGRLRAPRAAEVLCACADSCAKDAEIARLKTIEATAVEMAAAISEYITLAYSKTKMQAINPHAVRACRGRLQAARDAYQQKTGAPKDV